MNKINILVTAIGGDIGSNIINILKEQNNLQFNIYGTDINDKNFSKNEVNKFYKVDKVNNSNYKKQILEIIKSNSIDYIIPVSEMEIIWFNNNINLFVNLKVHILINNNEIIKNFLDKLITSKILSDIKIKTPKTMLLNDFNNEIEYPLIIKNKFSIKGKDIYKVNTKNQLNHLKSILTDKKNYIIQEYLGTDADEYTTAVYKDTKIFEVITFKRVLTGGMTSFATIENSSVLVNYATIIAKKLDLNGSINIQSRKIGDDFYIFEINPRLSSTIYIRNHFGFQDLLWWIKSFDNKNIFPFIKVQKVQKTGYSILGYKYKFFNEDNNENRKL